MKACGDIGINKIMMSRLKIKSELEIKEWDMFRQNWSETEI